ncbi:MAG: cobalt-precorrin-5B (C(1))-methyltransferase CbiD [Coriobacteriales bacterium]|nr:cobalt-precorrin-5B (C(1))-methyltransferase CbiD [Coriobacteriales bacterium]
MHQLDEYISTGGKLLRCGYTTGTCAAAATRAAAELLLGGVEVPSVVMSVPAGIDVLVEVEEAERGNTWARCAVRKDAGDDPDVTDGVLVVARVSLAEIPGVTILGGEGVGRVTRPGLDQPVGAAAINAVPRTMITQEAQEASRAHGYQGGLVVEISIPEGVVLAQRTFNPRLGIEGGISVLGTSGIVRPMSEEALVSSLKLELRVKRATGVNDVLVVPGNYGHDFAVQSLGLSDDRMVSCSNYVGAVLDEAVLLGFRTLLLVGHVGKLVKVAGGIMNTHSRVADCRMEILAAHAALAGATAQDIALIMGAATTDAALDVLDEHGLLTSALQTMVDRLGAVLSHRAGESLQVEALMFSNKRGTLGMTAGAETLMELHRHGLRLDEGAGETR